MPRRIISATDYGFRKVVRLVMDDTLPEYIHPEDNDDPHTPQNARGPTLPDGTRGNLNPSLQAGTECHACLFNHDVREYTFTREELQIEDPSEPGIFRNKTDSELVVEIQFRLLPVPPTVPIRPLTNQII